MIQSLAKITWTYLHDFLKLFLNLEKVIKIDFVSMCQNIASNLLVAFLLVFTKKFRF